MRTFGDAINLVTLKNSRKAFLPIIGIIVLAILAVLLLGGLSIFIAVLASNIYRLAGVLILVLLAISFFTKPLPAQFYLWGVALAAVLLFFPVVIDGLRLKILAAVGT